MEWIMPTIATGVATATATTFDDNIYLAMFFSRVDRQFRPRHVVVGEFLGFSALVAISLSGFLAGRMMSAAWIGLLGLVPIGIGVNYLLARNPESEAAVEEIILPTETTAARQQRRRESNRIASRRNYGSPSIWQVLRDPQTYRVSAVTLANGGNNIAIYIPLFASATLPRLGIILAICYAAIGLWCFISYTLIRKPATAALMASYVRRAVPFVLIWLGASIMIRSGTHAMLLNLGTGSIS
jgi:cadmium resistance protein CadD (predicted permease)